MHLTVTLMQFDLVTCRAPSHHPETPGREIHRQMDWIWISSSSSMQTCSGFDSDQASSSSKARTSYRGRPATVRQASPRAPARLRGSSSPLLACLIPTDLAPVPVPSSAAPGRTHMHAGCTGEELSFSTEPSVLHWDLTSLVVYSSHQALSSLFF